MNSDQRNQNQQVNYDFITNQGQEVGMSSKKPKDRRLIIIGVLVGVTVVMFAVLALTTNNSVKQSTKNDSASQQVAESHLKFIVGDQSNEAIKLYSKAEEISQPSFDAFWLNMMSSKYDLSKCVYSKSSEQTSEGKVTIEMFCPFKDEETGRILTYKIDQKTGLIDEVSDVMGLQRRALVTTKK